MGQIYTHLTADLQRFIQNQHMFFVGTAPLESDGHVNISPKGLDSLRILDESTVAYLDLIGSGIETLAHLHQNGRIVILFCAFEGAPRIVRLHGRGEAIEPRHEEFAELSNEFPSYTGVRAIMRIHCTRISDSCGYGVPLYEFQGPRSQLLQWADRKGSHDLNDYVRRHNQQSIDGLPGASTRD